MQPGKSLLLQPESHFETEPFYYIGTLYEQRYNRCISKMTSNVTKRREFKYTVYVH